MPAVAITERQRRQQRVARRNKKLESYIRELMRASGIRQNDCADLLGMTQGAFSLALSNMTFKSNRLLLLLDFLGADPEEITEILFR